MTREHAGSKLTIEHAGSQANTLVLSEICRYNPIPWSAAAYNSIYKHVRQLQAPPISLAESSAETTHKPHGGSDTCKNVTSLPKYGVLLTPKYGQKKVPYAEMRFFFCTHVRLYDLPTRRPPRWQLLCGLEIGQWNRTVGCNRIPEIGQLHQPIILSALSLINQSQNYRKNHSNNHLPYLTGDFPKWTNL